MLFPLIPWQGARYDFVDISVEFESGAVLD
jgi:hypothetical protein